MSAGTKVAHTLSKCYFVVAGPLAATVTIVEISGWMVAG